MAGPKPGELGRSRSSPMVFMLMVRAGRWRSAGHSSAARCTGNWLELDISRPPAGLRQAPIRAGRQAMARTALPPPRTRCIP